ncbi:MAG: GTP-binding protein [Hyphomonadaceae bacterium]|nr:MAG: GTP-binding protein [Hyphomonadaceae bacterium]KAF0187066.1 MAG: GTP-binding protein [Hyphomonadaceae bacterium]
MDILGASDAEKSLLRLEPVFMWAAATMSQLPPMGANEVAFAGRSNVGKSSLVNATLNRRGLARASSEPGRTRELIFFSLNDKVGAEYIRIVDLPGYGYARASKTEIARWTSATRDFLKGRTALKRVFVLIDARHGLKPNDLEILKELDGAAVSYQIILTKTDKLKSAELTSLNEKTAAIIAKRPAAHPEVMAVSAHNGQGLQELREEIMSLA